MNNVQVDFVIIIATLLIIGVGFLQHVKSTRYPFIDGRIKPFSHPDPHLFISEEHLHGRYIVTVLQLFYILAILFFARIITNLT